MEKDQATRYRVIASQVFGTCPDYNRLPEPTRKNISDEIVKLIEDLGVVYRDWRKLRYDSVDRTLMDAETLKVPDVINSWIGRMSANLIVAEIPNTRIKPMIDTGLMNTLFMLQTPSVESLNELIRLRDLAKNGRTYEITRSLEVNRVSHHFGLVNQASGEMQ